MKKTQIAALLSALFMTVGTVQVSAEEITNVELNDPIEVIQADIVTFDVPDNTIYTDVSAEYQAEYFPEKPTIIVKTAFGGKTITFDCADTDADIYYNFGSSNINTSSRHAKVGETVFIDEPMATGIYFKSYKNGKWCKEVGKLGFNNVQIAHPIILQSGVASENKYKIYTQTANS
ncbi:MAG: hypothetical protein ILP19_07465, partial [Oscillospiraceae bacterium]|nr:hypothetical protein [Oscillospiraceae bacterium]